MGEILCLNFVISVRSVLWKSTSFSQSMLRPFSSFPRSCPAWMHNAVTSRASFEDLSPMSSDAEPFYNERCRDVYDYGFGESLKQTK